MVLIEPLFFLFVLNCFPAKGEELSGACERNNASFLVGAKSLDECNKAALARLHTLRRDHPGDAAAEVGCVENSPRIRAIVERDSPWLLPLKQNIRIN